MTATLNSIIVKALTDTAHRAPDGPQTGVLVCCHLSDAELPFSNNYATLTMIQR